MTAPPGDRIEHMVLLMLENHSFDQMLGGLAARVPELDGVDPRAAPRVNRDDAGRPYPQTPITARQVLPDPRHDVAHVAVQLEGDNGGFVRDFLASHGDGAAAACADVMGYYADGFLPALHALAHEFTVCDRWFSSVPGPTWPNRFFALSGTSNGRALMPEDAGHLEMLWDQTQDTLFDRLDAVERSWAVFFYDFPVSLLLRNQRRPEHLARYFPVSDFFARAAGDAAAFPSFVLVEPQYLGIGQNDDHPPHNVMKAQKLVADVYNAIRSNPALWETTLLVVVYDEHGGFYDHVPPPRAVPPAAPAAEIAFDRLGVRVPAVLVSPWVDRRVEKTTFDHTSLLKYLTEKWGLGPLGARTAAAASIGCAITRSTPREGTPPFLRVPQAALEAPDPELERRDAAAHHGAPHLAADALARELEGVVGSAALEAARRARGEGALHRLLARLGDALIAWGRALRGPLERAEAARVERTRAAVARVMRP